MKRKKNRTTSFKRVCRLHGIESWPYKSLSPPGGTTEPGPSSAQVNPTGTSRWFAAKHEKTSRAQVRARSQSHDGHQYAHHETHDYLSPDTNRGHRQRGRAAAARPCSPRYFKCWQINLPPRRSAGHNESKRHNVLVARVRAWPFVSPGKCCAHSPAVPTSSNLPGCEKSAGCPYSTTACS